MTDSRIRSLFAGILMGIVGLVLGVGLMALIYMGLTKVTFGFLQENYELIFTSSPLEITTGVLLINFILFYLTMSRQRQMYAQGIMIVCILAIITAIILS